MGGAGAGCTAVSHPHLSWLEAILATVHCNSHFVETQKCHLPPGDLVLNHPCVCSGLRLMHSLRWDLGRAALTQRPHPVSVRFHRESGLEAVGRVTASPKAKVQDQNLNPYSTCYTSEVSRETAPLQGDPGRGPMAWPGRLGPWDVVLSCDELLCGAQDPSLLDLPSSPHLSPQP